MVIDEPTLRIEREFTQYAYDEEYGKAVLVYSDEEQATRCVVRLERYGPEFTYTRETTDQKWPYEKGQLERLLQKAFEQGRGAQKALTSQVLKTVIG